MWPTLVNMSRDDCRRTLRRLELEAYSHMIDVFRAQGALEDNRKKILEELRAVLHISSDRHSAEARRVANDEILATIAEQLAGPNTNIGWVNEGKRLIPLMPRGIPQSAYTEIADKAAEEAREENRKLRKKLSQASTRSNADSITAEGDVSEQSLTQEEDIQLPIATEDPVSKLWETELISRKRKITEGSTTDDALTPVKNVKNISSSSNQKHLNLSQLYSKYSQPSSSKQSSHSKHSYNQVSKVSTGKSGHGHAPRGQTKHRAPRQSKKATKSQAKKPQDLSPTKQYNSNTMQVEYSGPPNTFQASYAQSLMGKSKSDYIEDIKSKTLTSPSMVHDSPTMQLLTQPATVPHELALAEASEQTDDPSLQAQTPITKQTISGKPYQLIIKKRGDILTEKKIVSDVKILQKPPENVKILPNRPVVIANEMISTPAKVVTTKVLGPVPKPQHTTPVISDKMIVVPKSSNETHLLHSKVIITSATSTSTITVSSSNVSPKIGETITAKGLPATDIKVSAAKTFLLNPKAGSKMVVVPAKARTKQGGEGQQLPLLHFKGMPSTMRLVPVTGSQTPVKHSEVKVLSKNAVMSTLPAKVMSVEPIKTANMADIVPVKGLPPVTTPKTKAIVRPASAKGNVIVVPKGTMQLGKAISLTKNGNDMSKIIMGKNVNQLLQAKHDQSDQNKSGNVIVLELNNDQAANATTMSEILDSRTTNTRILDCDRKEAHQKITEDTPVLFESQIADEACNASSLSSTAESLGDIVTLDPSISIIDKEVKRYNENKEDGKDSSSVTDWEIELETVSSRKGKDDDDKLNSLHLDLGMSSDSDTDFIGERHKRKSKHSPMDSLPENTPSVESRETFEVATGLPHAARTLLSQLQDEGSSSNDSSFALKSKSKLKDESRHDTVLDKSESDALNKAKQKLTEKVAKSQKRIDIYSTAISSSDINLDSFSYLDEELMAGDEEPRRVQTLDDQLCRLLVEDSTNDSQSTSESSPSNKH